jgi:hypothetical protein
MQKTVEKWMVRFQNDLCIPEAPMNPLSRALEVVSVIIVSWLVAPPDMGPIA